MFEKNDIVKLKENELDPRRLADFLGEKLVVVTARNGKLKLRRSTTPPGCFDVEVPWSRAEKAK